LAQVTWLTSPVEEQMSVDLTLQKYQVKEKGERVVLHIRIRERKAVRLWRCVRFKLQVGLQLKKERTHCSSLRLFTDWYNVYK
jgi:hypothetical protein